MDVQDLTKEITSFAESLAVWAGQALPNLIGAILLLLLGWWFASWAARALGRALDNSGRIDKSLHSVLKSVIRYAILVLVFVAVLSQLGIQTTSILAALGAMGLAIGLALQGTLSNIASGIMLLWLRPIQVGDYIDAEGASGTIVEIGLFASQLRSWDGIYQFVPNSQIWNRRITNYSRMPTRLVHLEIGIGYDDDIDKAREILMGLATGDERVKTEPEPIFFVNSLGDNAVNVVLRAWTSTGEYWNVLREFTERGKKELEAAGLSIPYPQRDIHHHGLPAPEAKPASKPGRTASRARS